MRRQEMSSIKNRLSVIILLFVCLPLIIFGLIWYEISSNTIEQEAIRSGSKTVQQISEYMDLYVSDLERSTYPFVTNSRIQTLLHHRTSSPYSYYQLSTAIGESLFDQMIYGRNDIFGISLVTSKGVHVTDYSHINQLDNLINMEVVRTRNERLLQDSADVENFATLGINRIGPTPVLTITRKLYDNTTYVYEGLLIIDVKLDQFSRILRNAAQDNMNVWLINNNKHIIYHPASDQLGQLVTDDVFKPFEQTPSGHFLSDIDGARTLTLFHRSDLTGWTMVAELPMEQLIGNLNRLRQITALLGMLIIGLALSAVSFFSLSLTSSLTHLQKLMKKVESGDWSVTLIKLGKRNDEIGSLYQSFIKMITELRNMMRAVQMSKLKEQEMEIKQRESALEAMQSQINPHFLYNTLEVINSYAIVDNNPHISKVAGALAHMFRYNIGNARQIVPLKDEIEHIQSYLEIQQERFRKLKVDIDVEYEPSEPVETVRLTLQPIVENAFIHGYQNHRLKPEYIGIAGRRDGEDYVLAVSDRGKGMPLATMEAYNAAFAASRHPEIDPAEGDKIKRIGLWNVHERIRLTFGDQYGLYIVRSDEAGTVIQAKIPYRAAAQDIQQGGEPHVSSHHG